MTLAKLLRLLIGCFLFQYGKNKENTQNGWGQEGPASKDQTEVHSEQKLPVPADPPVLEMETPPTQSELEKKIEEAEKFGEVGGHQSHC